MECVCVCVTHHTHISLTAFCITRGITSAMALAHASMCLSCFRHHIVKVYDLALSTLNTTVICTMPASLAAPTNDWLTGRNRPPREGAHCCVAAIQASPRTCHIITCIITCPPGFGARTFQPGRRAQGERSEAVAHRRDTHPSVRGGRGRRWQGAGRGRGRGGQGRRSGQGGGRGGQAAGGGTFFLKMSGVSRISFCAGQRHGAGLGEMGTSRVGTTGVGG